MEASVNFQQLAQRFTDPIQSDYEVIRDDDLHDGKVGERSLVTGVDCATVAEPGTMTE